MISKNVFDFLKELEQNNEREWFNKNKHLYTNAYQEMLQFIDSLIQKMASKNISEIKEEIDISQNDDSKSGLLHFQVKVR